IKFERRAALLKSIARGRAWLEEIICDTTTVEAIAARHKCSVRHVNMTISMAFIAPALVKAAVEGRLPRGIGVAALHDMPAECRSSSSGLVWLRTDSYFRTILTR
ncbi:MAG TPA: hypothetical protein VFN63_06595, partial [Pseudolabrys sp.]|nr:hypothetical protein [Pseudolabrys sp.]